MIVGARDYFNGEEVTCLLITPLIPFPLLSITQVFKVDFFPLLAHSTDWLMIILLLTSIMQIYLLYLFHFRTNYFFYSHLWLHPNCCFIFLPFLLYFLFISFDFLSSNMIEFSIYEVIVVQMLDDVNCFFLLFGAL